MLTRIAHPTKFPTGFGELTFPAPLSSAIAHSIGLYLASNPAYRLPVNPLDIIRFDHFLYPATANARLAGIRRAMDSIARGLRIDLQNPGFEGVTDDIAAIIARLTSLGANEMLNCTLSGLAFDAYRNRMTVFDNGIAGTSSDNVLHSRLQSLWNRLGDGQTGVASYVDARKPHVFVGWQLGYGHLAARCRYEARGFRELSTVGDIFDAIIKGFAKLFGADTQAVGASATRQQFLGVYNSVSINNFSVDSVPTIGAYGTNTMPLEGLFGLIQAASALHLPQAVALLAEAGSRIVGLAELEVPKSYRGGPGVFIQYYWASRLSALAYQPLLVLDYLLDKFLEHPAVRWHLEREMASYSVERMGEISAALRPFHKFTPIIAQALGSFNPFTTEYPWLFESGSTTAYPVLACCLDALATTRVNVFDDPGGSPGRGATGDTVAFINDLRKRPLRAADRVETGALQALLSATYREGNSLGLVNYEKLSLGYLMEVRRTLYRMLKGYDGKPMSNPLAHALAMGAADLRLVAPGAGAASNALKGDPIVTTGFYTSAAIPDIHTLRYTRLVRWRDSFGAPAIVPGSRLSDATKIVSAWVDARPFFDDRMIAGVRVNPNEYQGVDEDNVDPDLLAVWGDDVRQFPNTVEDWSRECGVSESALLAHVEAHEHLWAPFFSGIRPRDGVKRVVRSSMTISIATKSRILIDHSEVDTPPSLAILTADGGHVTGHTDEVRKEPELDSYLVDARRPSLTDDIGSGIAKSAAMVGGI